MKPTLDGSRFGSIVINGETFKHDVLIRLDGRVSKRQKELSKAVYGTSHILSLAEAQHVYEQGAARLIVGAGQFGTVKLADDAAAFFEENQCLVDLWPMSQAMEAWNRAEGPIIGLFHITC
jgi:hypothetical protein